MAKDGKPPKPSSSGRQQPPKTTPQQHEQPPSSSSTPASSTPQPPPPPPPPQEPPKASSKPAESPEEQIPLSELPDLTQGIPSTLEYETAGTTQKAELEAVDQGAASGSGGRGKGELPASAYVSSTERRRQKTAQYMFGLSILGMVGGVVYLGRNWDDEDLSRHPDVPNGWGLGPWWNRASTRMKEVMTYYHEPAFEKLLPDPDPSFERPYTLVISLEDMLVHSEWSREHGWRLAKRPGVDYFLHYLSQYYELVLFTTVPFAIAEPLIRKLDPYHFIMWPLFREATKYKDGEIIKVNLPFILDRHAAHPPSPPPPGASPPPNPPFLGTKLSQCKPGSFLPEP